MFSFYKGSPHKALLQVNGPNPTKPVHIVIKPSSNSSEESRGWMVGKPSEVWLV